MVFLAYELICLLAELDCVFYVNKGLSRRLIEGDDLGSNVIYYLGDPLSWRQMFL